MMDDVMISVFLWVNNSLLKKWTGKIIHILEGAQQFLSVFYRTVQLECSARPRGRLEREVDDRFMDSNQMEQRYMFH